MPQDELGMKDKINIVLRGPDGKVKDERKPGTKRAKRVEFRDKNGMREPTDKEKLDMG